ncbi:endonuclease [Flavobacterium phage vB_FspM_immuto_2-6A]|jgi:predicted Holliday junction resolvase-like endonuclease|uniref:Endonuclease n=1 Tax=Flavobacterium phage vB_FspM_immuto_2-6A TaxID=2801477 RepID=A0A7T8ERC0_9CAUD|nr:endonuclease [Flavobacterium phage vB_FspM_immuto_2-6A]QQO91690.1 endonuclease [Flavobacterium phage vB_FspM_immuto_2-6A]
MIYVIVSSLFAIGVLVYLMNMAKAEIRKLEDLIVEKELELVEEVKKARKDSKFRSSAVNWGKSIEHFVPFMTKFPVPPEDVVFLGMPIDYVGFTDTESSKKCKVHFIEVKSGVSFMSTKQKNIKKAIEEGRIEFHEIAVESNKAE